mmetsp:Transcript_2243/g.6150  ORF Transcript_2243/g.6150 Transcript_2243/m.6150 type:complete len:323 (+) Transcript_2243:236-1204(+)
MCCGSPFPAKSWFSPSTAIPASPASAPDLALPPGTSKQASTWPPPAVCCRPSTDSFFFAAFARPRRRRPAPAAELAPPAASASDVGLTPPPPPPPLLSDAMRGAAGSFLQRSKVLYSDACRRVPTATRMASRHRYASYCCKGLAACEEVSASPRQGMYVLRWGTSTFSVTRSPRHAMPTMAPKCDVRAFPASINPPVTSVRAIRVCRSTHDRSSSSLAHISASSRPACRRTFQWSSPARPRFLRTRKEITTGSTWWRYRSHDRCGFATSDCTRSRRAWQAPRLAYTDLAFWGAAPPELGVPEAPDAEGALAARACFTTKLAK